MFAGLLKLLPWRDWVYAAIAVGAIGYYNVHVHNLTTAAVAHELASIQKTSDALKAQAVAKVAALTADYNRQLTAAQEKYAQDTQAATVAHDADLQRLLQLASAYRHADRAVPSSPGTSGQPSTSARPDSAGSVGSLPQGLNVSLGLADALRFDDNLLATCRAERDTLTGK